MTASDRTLLGAVAVELADVRTGVDGLSGLLAGLVRGLPIEDRAEALTGAQALDALTQRLDALSDVLQALAAGKPADEAVRGVNLADVAARLGGGASPTPADTAGDLMLFD